MRFKPPIQSIPDPAQRPALGVHEVAELLGISKDTAYKAVREGHLPSVKMTGRMIAIPTAELRSMFGLDDEPSPESNDWLLSVLVEAPPLRPSIARSVARILTKASINNAA